MSAPPARDPISARPALVVPEEISGRRLLPHVEPSTVAHESARPGRLTDPNWREAQDRANVCEQFLRLREQDLSTGQAARALGRSPSLFCGADSWLARYQRGGVAALLPERGQGGAAIQFEVPDWFVPAARFFYLLTNRTSNRGSVPEAIRRTISLPHLPVGWGKAMKARFVRRVGSLAGRQTGHAGGVCSPEWTTEGVPTCPAALREQILAREKAGQPMVPERIAKLITVNPATIEQHRRPREAGLKHLSSPGTMMVIRTDRSASDPYQEEVARAGGILEADDGSINFPACIPWKYGGNACADEYGVIVGRFQWLRAIDVGSRFRPGWIFVARQRGSYRGADILSLLHGIAIQHGVWDRYRFERGSWQSNLVTRAIEQLGAELQTVVSPHSKPFIEGGFNQDWTKLSVHFPQCDLGRYRGDTEETNKLIQACRAGQKDPRRLFPMLSDAIKAFDQVTAEENATPVNSKLYGRWVPEERWKKQIAERPPRALAPEIAWAFAPYAREWTVRGMLVGGRVPIFEAMSVPFDFSAPWLTQFHGARVRCHFDPAAPRCRATVVLLQDWGTARAGEVLGEADQINEVAGYARLVLGWGDDPATAGLKAKQQAAAAMRSELRTVLPKGGKGYAKSEERDGIQTATTAERENIEHPTSNIEHRIADLEKFEKENEHLFI